MEKKTKIIAISATVVVLVAVGYAIYWYMNLPTPTTEADGTLTVNHLDAIDNNKVLSINDKSNSVKSMQEAINKIIDKYGYTTQKVSTDGVFGKKTQVTLGVISANKLFSGNVTANKVLELEKISSAPLFAPVPLPTYPFLSY